VDSDGKKNHEKAEYSIIDSHISPEVIYSISTPCRKGEIKTQNRWHSSHPFSFFGFSYACRIILNSEIFTEKRDSICDFEWLTFQKKKDRLKA
jgi:hypothetical protein